MSSRKKEIICSSISYFIALIVVIWLSIIVNKNKLQISLLMNYSVAIIICVVLGIAIVVDLFIKLSKGFESEYSHIQLIITVLVAGIGMFIISNYISNFEPNKLVEFELVGKIRTQNDYNQDVTKLSFKITNTCNKDISHLVGKMYFYDENKEISTWDVTVSSTIEANSSKEVYFLLNESGSKTIYETPTSKLKINLEIKQMTIGENYDDFEIEEKPVKIKTPQVNTNKQYQPSNMIKIDLLDKVTTYDFYEEYQYSTKFSMQFTNLSQETFKYISWTCSVYNGDIKLDTWDFYYSNGINANSQKELYVTHREKSSHPIYDLPISQLKMIIQINEIITDDNWYVYKTDIEPMVLINDGSNTKEKNNAIYNLELNSTSLLQQYLNNYFEENVVMPQTNFNNILYNQKTECYSSYDKNEYEGVEVYLEINENDKAYFIQNYKQLLLDNNYECIFDNGYSYEFKKDSVHIVFTDIQTDYYDDCYYIYVYCWTNNYN